MNQRGGGAGWLLVASINRLLVARRSLGPERYIGTLAIRGATRHNGRRYPPDMNVIDWLLDSDPSIRWQVMRDLTHEPADVIAAERSRVATEGWGARLLALQAPDGRWAGRPWSQDWTDTFHVLELLRRFGLDPESEQARRAIGLVREHVTWRDPDFETPWADNRFFEGEVEPCINGNVVATGSYFGVDMAPLVERLLGEQLAGRRLELRGRERRDGSSFGTTINVVEGLLEYERAIGGSDGARGPPARRGVHARAPAVPPEVDRRGDRPELAPVLVPALVLLRRPARARPPARRRRRARRARRRGDRGRQGQSDRDGRWPLQNVHEGETHLEMDDGEGQPSRWNTLRAMRVLNWFAQSG